MNAVLPQLADRSLQVLRSAAFPGSRNQRAIAEAVADAIGQQWNEICRGIAQAPKADYSAKHMADVSCKIGDRICWINLKTRNTGRDFSMPNLTSVRGLEQFYVDPHHYFLLLMVEYRLDSRREVVIDKVELIPVEALDWSCLQIAALGRGQLQIRNAKNIVIAGTVDRAQWLDRFYQELVSFYEREMLKDRADLARAQRRLADLRRQEAPQ